MREHFERGHIINVKIVADEDPFDGERRAYLRGLFIEREAGRPWAYEARARPGARQRFAFDTRFVDFAELLYALGLPALGVCEPLGVEAIRAEAPSRNNVPPILGFRSPLTAKEWRPGRRIVVVDGPICETCGDTHQMELDGHGKAPCTRCPVPCNKCREGGVGAYCANTPCSCGCHVVTT